MTYKVRFEFSIYGAQLSRVRLTHRAELPFVPVPGMSFHDGDFEATAHEVKYSIDTGGFEVHVRPSFVEQNLDWESARAEIQELTDFYLDTGWKFAGQFGPIAESEEVKNDHSNDES